MLQQSDLCTSSAKVAELRTKEIIQELTRRYGNRNLLVKEFTTALSAVKAPGPSLQSAADFIMTLNTKLQRMLRKAKENRLVKSISHVGHTLLLPYFTMYSEDYAKHS